MPASDPNQTTLITTQELKTARYAISKDIRPERIDPEVEAASDRLRLWVGETVYEEALAADESLLASLSASEQRRIKRRWAVLKGIEGDLAMHYLTLNLNTYVTPEGQLLEARSEGAVTHRYLTPAQCAERARQWLDQAIIKCEPYRVPQLEADIALQEIDLA